MCTKIITRAQDCVHAMCMLVTRGAFLNLNQVEVCMGMGIPIPLGFPCEWE